MCEKNVIKIPSNYLHNEVTVGVIVPDRVEKLLLLLHGYGGSFRHLDENLPLTEYAMSNNMLIVTPNMNNGYYLDKPDYNVSQFLLSELVPHVLGVYGKEEKLPMYLAGISMGGYGSLLIGAHFPERFRKVISISGAFIAHDVAIGNPQVVGGPGETEALKYFTETFAPFDTLEIDAHRNPIAAVVKCKNVELPELILTCGTEDELYSRNLIVLETLDKMGVSYEWYPSKGGAHDYKAFNDGLRYAFDTMK